MFSSVGPLPIPGRLRRGRCEGGSLGGLSKLLTATAGALDRRFGWDRLPRPLGVLTLVGLRNRLRDENLYDTGAGERKPAPNGDAATSRRTATGPTTTSTARRWG